jgi:two-component system response regulator AtoC
MAALSPLVLAAPRFLVRAQAGSSAHAMPGHLVGKCSLRQSKLQEVQRKLRSLRRQIAQGHGALAYTPAEPGVLAMRHDADRSTAQELPPPAAPSMPGHRLLVMRAETWTAHELPGEGAVTIGRGPDADIRVPEQGVSRHHARLDVLPGGAGFQITDLGSRNGTRVRQVVVLGATAAIAPGEAIGIGKTLLVIQQAVSSGDAPGPLPPARRVPSRSPAMQRVEAVLDRVAGSMVNVLLLGETGVGKDVLAEDLHGRSSRANAPFLRINCATLTPTLLESELFGHERGAFTGAAQAKPGLLEVARGGTVFLDEIGELPLEMQAKLLLVLEERTVRRVGAVRGSPIDVRFVSATNRDLATDIRTGRFRADLYYRLDGFRIVVPPLRDRLDDLETFVAHFMKIACARRARACPVIEPEALEVLRRHPWPGNLRELRNVIERTLVLHDGATIAVRDLWHADAAPEAEASPADDGRDAERRRVIDALTQCGGNQSRAAQLLGMSRNTLLARIRTYNLTRPRSP